MIGARIVRVGMRQDSQPQAVNITSGALDASIDTLYGGFAVSAPFQYVVVICHQKAMQVNLG